MNPFVYMGLWLVAAGGTGVTVALSLNRATQEAAIAVPIFVLLAVAVNLTFIYKLWDAIQFGGQARTTPGKAIGFMFIPLFNIYWLFQVLPGWATDYNATIKAHNINAPEAPHGLMAAHAVFSFINIPVVSLVVQLASIFKACTAVTALKAARGG